MGINKFGLALASVVGFSGAADAAVQYTFTGAATVGTGAFGGGPVSGSFSVTLANFVAAPTFVGASGLATNYCSVSVGTSCSAFLSPETNPFFNTYGPGDKVALRSQSTGLTNESIYNFADNAFNGFGTFLSTGANVGTLIVSDASAVPEPTSWALFIGGFGLVGSAMRRRRVSVSFA